jgi:hypothetical protein
MTARNIRAFGDTMLHAQMTFGFVDWERHRQLCDSAGRQLRVYLDGVDITDHCHWANDETGEAYVFRVDADGKYYLDPENTDAAAHDIVKGTVEIR